MKKIKLHVPFVTAFFVLLLCETIVGITAILKNQKEEKYTQISQNIPLNTYNKIFVSIEETNHWMSEDDYVNTIYECTFENSTQTDFKDWNIRIKLPKDSEVISTWNGNLTYDNDYAIITTALEQTAILRANSTINLGFILKSPNKAQLKPIILSGKFIYKLTENILFWIFLVLIFIDLMIIMVIFINKHVLKLQQNAFNSQKLRDDAIIEQTIHTFVNFIDAKDEYTRGHSARVAKYSKALAAQLGYDEQFQKDIYYMGLMHDIGKLSIPDEILNKTTRLSSEEWEIIQLHTTNGVKMLRDFSIMPELKDAVLYHHERYDGKGYVNQLKGDDIPLAARIICIADSFDAMNTNRCYRLKFSKERIILELERCAGKQFDPKLIPAMVEIIRNGTIDKL